MNFNIDGKKLKSHICLKDFNNRHKIVKDGSRILNIINGHFATVGNRLANKLPIPQKHHLDYVDKCKSSISSFLFRPLLPEELRSEYYLYRMINLMVYTPHLPNYSNVQVPSQLLFLQRHLKHRSDWGLIHQSSKLLKLRQYLRVTITRTQTTADRSLYSLLFLIEYLRK